MRLQDNGLELKIEKVKTIADSTFSNRGFYISAFCVLQFLLLI